MCVFGEHEDLHSKVPHPGVVGVEEESGVGTLQHTVTANGHSARPPGLVGWFVGLLGRGVKTGHGRGYVTGLNRIRRTGGHRGHRMHREHREREKARAGAAAKVALPVIISIPGPCETHDCRNYNF